MEKPKPAYATTWTHYAPNFFLIRQDYQAVYAGVPRREVNGGAPHLTHLASSDKIIYIYCYISASPSEDVPKFVTSPPVDMYTFPSRSRSAGFVWFACLLLLCACESPPPRTDYPALATDESCTGDRGRIDLRLGRSFNSAIQDWARHNVFIDEQKVGEVNINGREVFETKPGWRSLRLRKGMAGSRPIDVEVPACGLAVIQCRFNNSTINSSVAVVCEAISQGDNNAPVMTADQRGIDVELSETVQEYRLGSETIQVPPGTIVEIRRSRTIEHIRNFRWERPATTASDTSTLQAVKEWIFRQISHKQDGGSGTYEQRVSETIEFSVKVDGNVNDSYQLYWVDRVRSGLANVVIRGKLTSVSFEFVESTNLRVEAQSVDAH